MTRIFTKRDLWQTCAISVILLYLTVNHWRADVSSKPLPWSSVNVHDYICRKRRNWPVFCLRIDLNQILQVLPALNLCLFVFRVGDHAADTSHKTVWKIQTAYNRKKNKLEKKKKKNWARDLKETRNAGSSLGIRPTRTLELWTIRWLYIKWARKKV